MNRFFLPATALVCVLAGCTAKQGSDEQAVFGVIRENLMAMEREDINGVMATMHPAMPDLADLRKENEKIFAKYDLKYELGEVKMASITKDEAKVNFVQKIRRVGGATDFPSLLTAEGVHTLKKDGDKWKLYNTVYLKFTPENP